MPIFDQPVFNIFYGEVAKAPEIAPYFLNFRPQLSPNGRYLLLPGMGGDTSPSGELGVGLWLVDLAEDKMRQLLPQARIATWSPDSDAITYVENKTLYTLLIAEDATPLPLFNHPNLWELYAHWSPDGRWIAAVTGTQSEPDAEAGYTELWIFDLITQENQHISSIAIDNIFPLHWSGDSKYLILGGIQDDKSLIWAMDAQTSNSSAEVILENALLIEVVRSFLRV